MTLQERPGLQPQSPSFTYDEFRQRRTSLEERGLSFRTLNIIHKRFGASGIMSLEQIPDADLLKARGIGKKTVAEIRQFAAYRG